MMSLFEKKMRETAFFKRLVAIGATPVFQEARGANLYFKLPTVEIATEAALELDKHLPQGDSTRVSRITNQLAPWDMDKMPITGILKVPDGHFVRTNIVCFRLTRPNSEIFVDKFLEPVRKIMEEEPAWLKREKSINPESVVNQVGVVLKNLDGPRRDDFIKQIRAILGGGAQIG